MPSGNRDSRVPLGLRKHISLEVHSRLVADELIGRFLGMDKS